MRGRDYTAATLFLSGWFGDALGIVELRALSHDKAGAICWFTPGDISDFCATHDKAGNGVYFGTCTRKTGTTKGTDDSVLAVPGLWVDIDCLKEGLAGPIVLDALLALPFVPSFIINSGAGFHAYWQFNAPVDVSGILPLRGRIQEALRRLVAILAGDASCVNFSRIMRLPGTMNTKPATLALYDGEPFICDVVHQSGARYGFDALAGWLKEQPVLLHHKKATKKPNALKDNDPFMNYARLAGHTPGMDVDAELAAMEYGGEGKLNIHQTQIRVAYSMIATGHDDEEIVEKILESTRDKQPAGANWNWKREEKVIRDDLAGARQKQENSRDPEEPIRQQRTTGQLAVSDIKEARAKRHPQRDPDDRVDQITLLGGACLAIWQDRYGPIMHSRGCTYIYEEGIWLLWNDEHDQTLRILMQEACASPSIKFAPKAALINAAIAYFMHHPAHAVRRVEFDLHGLIIAGDGTIDPKTGSTGAHSPEHMAKFKVGANIDGERECPAFLTFLSDSFADKDVAEIPDIIRTIQEWFGACLISNKSRSLAKGMLVHGGSRTGKTQLSEILRALLGPSHTSATSAGDIGGDFGLQTFLDKRGWVADDAIGQDEFLHAERYKKIVTGEEVGVMRKNKTEVQARFGFPVMLTANHLPKIRDQSDAVYNRSLILPMTRVRPESMPEPHGYHSIAAKIIAEELTGVLWWAFKGWQQLYSRGVFAEPECMKRAVSELKEHNDPFGTWLKECVVYDEGVKLNTVDLFASFAGYWYEQNGDAKFNWSQTKSTKRIVEAMPNVIQKREGVRLLAGIRINDLGKEYWSINADRGQFSSVKSKLINTDQINQTYSKDHSDRAAKGYHPADPDAPITRGRTVF